MSEELADAIVDEWDLQAWIEERFPRGRRVN